MSKQRVPVKNIKSTANKLKNAKRKSAVHTNVSLKAFAKEVLAKNEDQELVMAAKDWQFNKRANPSNPSLGLGSTRKKSKSNKKTPVATTTTAEKK